MTTIRLRTSSIVLLTVVALSLVWLQGEAPAAPPSNDNCPSATELVFGVPFLGTSSEASNDYVATTALNPDRTLAPSSGRDVVYRVVVPAGESAFVSVKAGFAVSLYASNTSCGTAAVVNNSPVVAGGPSLALTSGTWSVIVDGWTGGDKGNFTIAASALTSAMMSTDPSAFNNMAKEIAALKKKLTATKSTVDRILRQVK